MTALEDRIRAGLHDAATRVPDRMTPTRYPERPGFPGWLKAVAAAVSVVVVIGGVGVFARGGPVGGGQVMRLALTQDVAALDGPAVVVNSSVSTNGFDPLPSMVLWQWGETGESAVWLVQTGLDADLTPLLGPTAEGEAIVAPRAGWIESLELSDVEWHALSWKDADVWYVVFGLDDAAVADIAGQLRGAAVTEATLRGEPPVPIDVSRLAPPASTELSELFYSSPAGGFSVGFFQGWPHGVEASVARLGEAATRTEVNGQQAVTFYNQVNSWVMWTVDGRSTAAVESSDLDMATLIEVAESVASLPLAEWRTLAGVEPADLPASTDDGAGFRALGDNGVVHLTITQLRDVSEIWSTRVGPELTDPDLWGRRAADVCMLGVWNPGMAELIASEYISQDLGSADEQVHSDAADAVWEIAAIVCPDAFPEGALETGPPSGARP